MVMKGHYMKKNKNIIVALGYMVSIICTIINFGITMPLATFICFIGVVMSGGVTSFLFVLLITFFSGMIVYLLGLLIFLLVSKKTFYKNFIIVMSIHFVISIFYSYNFINQF